MATQDYRKDGLRPVFTSLTRVFLAVPLLAVLALPELGAQATGKDLEKLKIRSLGPGVMGGRVIDLAVNERRPSEYYVATASGGLWKTVNNGTTFEPLFQNQGSVVSIGAVAMAPTDPKQIWVGTGEANNRNSSSWGNGVYFSNDGGKTFTFKGLPKSQHIPRIAVHPTNPKIVYVAALGGLWGSNPERGLYRTQNGGETWELVLKGDDKTGCGEVRIDPENPDIVYTALYERQRDAYDGNHPIKRWGPGSGLYRSMNGGDSWKKLVKGLPTVKIGRISLDIYRKNPAVVYALIETEDIGKRPRGAPPPTQSETGPGYFGVSGVQDGIGGALLEEIVDGSPAASAGLEDKDILLEMGDKPTATADDFTAILSDSKPGQKVELKVLRGRKVEKITITLGENPNSRFRRGGRGNLRLPFADRIGGQNANVQKRQGPEGYQTGGVFRTEDRGETWERINSLNPRPYYFSQIRVDPSDEKYLYICGIQFHMSSDRGARFNNTAGRGVHADVHALWVNPEDGRNLILGCDGGMNITYDRCKTWESYDNLVIGQCYHAIADNRKPYWVYAGYQDNGSWGGPSISKFSEGILREQFFKVGGGDGFICRVDPEDPNVVFTESQGGRIAWRNIMTGQRGSVRRPRAPSRQNIRPRPGAVATRGGPITIDAASPKKTVETTDAEKKKEESAKKKEVNEAVDAASSSPGQDTRQDRGAGERRNQGGNQRGRQQGRGRRGNWNWDTPFILSKYNSKTIYFGGEYVCKSRNRGANTIIISPKITLGAKGSATELAESPRVPGLLYVGTDDGALWVTRDDGEIWVPLHDKLATVIGNGGKPLWVSGIAVSHFKEGRAYVSLDGHRVDDRNAYVFVTEDFGETWKKLSDDLPESTVHVVMEDSKVENLLYVGSEVGLWFSQDRGKTWLRMPNTLPTVAVRGLDIQEREEDLIIGTHGRSIWTLDIRALRAMAGKSAKDKFLLVKPADVLRLKKRKAGKLGHRYAVIKNPREEASFYYWLANGSDGVSIEVRDLLGKVVWKKTISEDDAKEGLHRVDWNLRQTRAAPVRGRNQGRNQARNPRGRRGFGRGRGGPAVAEGRYTVKLIVGDKSATQVFQVEDDKTPFDISYPRPLQLGEGGDLLVEDAEGYGQEQETGQKRRIY